MIGPAFPEVLAAARVRAPWAFEAIYRDLSGPVTGYLRLHGAADPDDVASEAFISVLTGLDAFTGDEDGFRAWVFTIAHRRLVDERRRAGRRPATTDDGAAALAEHRGGDAEEDALAALGVQRVRDLCSRLSPDQRSVLLLRVLGDLTVEQVAAVVGRSPAAVKALQRRGLLALAGDLGVEAAPPAARPAMTVAR